MHKPEVRIIEPQSEQIVPSNISKSERDYLLAKYGYKTINDFNPENISEVHPDMHLSFEELIRREELKNKEKIAREMQLRNRPNPISIDSNRVNYYENKYSDLDINGSNYGIEVQIFSDMPINKSRNR